ncbi:MBL fold metallo-hydrolase [Cryptosporangium arvum]|uniref:Zn-dependent hydrolase, glyoxylase n=1 Tax=Cryptosporangium arvum DSM 44712 TaxID=927661 RepID=A0A010ZUH6_9ACTN|nr:MBL fold metallo-hydrolase [Cryptosporangium arvum]EXG82329.1 Zn-dependent hydrolase, glyoxylase [Cryptosporangium arvum DSM 44712]
MSAVPADTTALDLGEITLTFVPDGELRADPAVAYPAGHEDIFTDGLDVVDEDGMLLLSIGAILVTAGTSRVLVDVGIGDRRIPLIRPGASRDGYMGGGALLRNLSALGVEPEQIDTILLTHLHADHVGWIGDGDATFPNAEYWVGEGEWQYWIRPENSGGPVGPRPNELEIIGSRRRRLVDGAEPVDGITAVDTAGHTPGHFGFAVRGTNACAFVVGDALHCPAEALRPDLAWVGDVDGGAAIRTRRNIAAHVRDTGAVLVGPHFPNAVFMEYSSSGLIPFATT